MEIKVKNCRECPFSDAIFEDGGRHNLKFANCLAPVEIHVDYEIDEFYKNYTSPEWCPLKKYKTVNIIYDE